jgi:hypothetical protein
VAIPIRELKFDMFRAVILPPWFCQSDPADLLFCSSLSAGRGGDGAMARIYRDVAIEQMLGTVEEAMCQAINWWADLPPSMKEAIEEFRTQLGTAIDSVEFVKRALDRSARNRPRQRSCLKSAAARFYCACRGRLRGAGAGGSYRVFCMQLPPMPLIVAMHCS